MRAWICLLFAVLPACAVFGVLSEEERKMLEQHRIGAQKFFNARQYEKAIDQAERGLALEPDDYKLKGPLAWSYLQMSFRANPDNEKFLRLAENEFAELIELRDIEDHDSKNVFGYAIALHNWARVEEERATRLRRESAKAEAADRQAMLAQAEEHERRVLRKDLHAKRYFLHVAEGDFAGRPNRREAYKYLMALEYRRKNYAEAIEYGKKNLELNTKDAKHWEAEYATTQFAEFERQIRKDLADLKEDELKVRSRLATYYRENNQHAEAIAHLDVILGARPNSAEDYYLRGASYRAVGQAEKAEADFKLFLQLGRLPREHEAVKDAQLYVYGRGK